VLFMNASREIERKGRGRGSKSVRKPNAWSTVCWMKSPAPWNVACEWSYAGCGALSIRDKRERQGRNPQTGEALIIDARRVVRFRASELLLARLNRRTKQRHERAKSDSRQLAFPIDNQQEEQGDMEPVIAAAPLQVGGRKTRRKRTDL
jgi:hypothetical protein